MSLQEPPFRRCAIGVSERGAGMKISQVEWLPVAKSAMKEYKKDDVPGLAAEMAYWIVFSLFPLFAFCGPRL